MRIALGLEYNGTSYHGWQAQDSDLATIQKVLEHAVSTVANHPVKVTCAGRTDAGVHAIGQVIHFDTSAERPSNAWVFGVNTYLPKDVRVNWIVKVADEFHARFSATARRYRYYIYNHHVPSAIHHRHITWFCRNLDIERMNNAAHYLLGEHDFTSFRGMDCQAKTPVRTLVRCNIERHDKIVVLDVTANAFLHHMVRNMAGVLMAIGSGKQEPIWAQHVLQAKDRRLAGVTAPADGLYLVEVDYPSSYGLPKPTPQSIIY